MEVNGLWPDDSLHALLDVWNDAAHWSDLGKKADMQAFARRLFDKAQTKVAQDMADEATAPNQ